MSARVCVVIVNWNGWRDTLECLESVLRVDGGERRVVVVDNGSDDDSLARLRAWAKGELPAPVNARDDRLLRLVTPPVPKPVALRELAPGDDDDDDDRAVRVLRVGVNRGFAAGVNAGFAHALADPSFTHVWVLNNDVVVEPEALSALLRRLDEKPGAGMCGSSTFFYGEPERAHAFGGARYLAPLGLAMHVGRLRGRRRALAPEPIERQLSYVFGAAILVRRQLIESVGPLCEDYFLYYEELDWALRARGRYTLAYAPDSVVYHKAGASAGSSRRATTRSPRSEYFLMRNRLWITRRFFPLCVPSVASLLCLTMAHRALTRRWPLLEADRRALFDGLAGSLLLGPP